MSVERFVRRNWFACLLVTLLTLLIGVWAWMELDNAWNDMNATMLVLMAFYFVDYPLHLVLHALIDHIEHAGTYLALLIVLGGVFWFVIGSLVAYACRWVQRSIIGNQIVADGA